MASPADFALFQEFLRFKAMGGSVAQGPSMPQLPPRTPFSPTKAMDILFTKMMPGRGEQHQNSALFYALKYIYSLQPDAFTLLGDGTLHLDPATGENYFSVRVSMGNTSSGNTHGCFLHIYGGQRGSAFIFTRLSAKMYDGFWPNAVIFQSRDSTSDNSSTRS